MLPHMFANWNQIYTTYRDFPEQGIFSTVKLGDYCPKETRDNNLFWWWKNCSADGNNGSLFASSFFDIFTVPTDIGRHNSV